MTTDQAISDPGPPPRAGRPGAPKPATRAAGGFRADIQGLRAVAVLAVVLNHAGVPHLSGGYVGVDVFFVISGYLITQLLLREAADTGTISLVGFYARRARRILPAATATVVVTAVTSTLLLSYVQALSVVRDGVWATFFAANVRFSRELTNYFSAKQPPSPLQHFWSLSVEEQFYVVWPLLLLVLIGGLAWQRRRRAPNGRPVQHRALSRLPLLVGLIAIIGVSLAWSIVMTRQQPTAAYFNTPARAWELAIGACCAVLAPQWGRWNGWILRVAGWAGLVAIGIAVVRFDSSTGFPGYAALLPVLGAALVVMGGSGIPAARGGASELLALLPLRRLGDWSYSFYLWHWPLLVVPAAYAGHALGIRTNLLLVLAALLVAYASYRWVEGPFRRPRGTRHQHPVRSLSLYPVAVGLIMLVSAFATHLVVTQMAAASQVPPITVKAYGPRVTPPGQDPLVTLVQASVNAAKADAPIPGHLRPSPLALDHNIAKVGACDYVTDIRQLCEHGSLGSKRVVVVFGDSHARAWIPAFDRLAAREGFATYYLVKPGCSGARVSPDFGEGLFEACLEWRDWAFSAIATVHPDLVVLSSDMPAGIDVTGEGLVRDQDTIVAAFLSGLEQSIDELQAGGSRVAVIGDVPGLDELPGFCLTSRGATLGDCASPRPERSRVVHDTEEAAASATGADFIDPVPWLCADDLCPAVVGATVTYRDQEHLSVPYAELLAEPLGRVLGMKPSHSSRQPKGQRDRDPGRTDRRAARDSGRACSRGPNRRAGAPFRCGPRVQHPTRNPDGERAHVARQTPAAQLR